jgi:hypothetical protein
MTTTSKNLADSLLILFSRPSFGHHKGMWAHELLCKMSTRARRRYYTRNGCMKKGKLP